MAKLKGLGKGLDALLGASNVVVSNVIDDGVKLKELALSELKSGKYQPRSDFNQDELQELANSIKCNGVVQPVVVRKLAKHYELIAGERRWRAAKMAGLATIPAIVRVLTDEEALAIGLIENIQRKDLNLIEEAAGYRRLIDEFNLTHEELAKITGKSRSHITNILRLLNLAAAVKDLLIAGKIDMGHARALLPLEQKLQLEIAQTIVANNMTTKEVENYVARLLGGKSELPLGKLSPRLLSPDIAKLENDLSDKLGMVVRFKHGTTGKGSLVISYSSLDELDNFLNYLK
jgi:ParB family chromosome partitioning protein